MNPKQLKKLKQEWEKKLAREGLASIENEHGQLHQWHSFHFKHPSVGHDLEARAQYFRNCEHFLNNHEFTSEKEHHIWELYSEGRPQRYIADAVKMKRRTMREVLKRLIAEMDKWVKLERFCDDF